MSDDDPRCPECGGKIGQTATYCMHCSADLTADRAAADANDDGTWDDVSGEETGSATVDGTGDGSNAGDDTNGGTDVPWARNDESDTDAEPTWGSESGAGGGAGSGSATRPDTDAPAAAAGDGEPMLDPDGLVDNSLTALVGIVGGFVVGVVGTVALLIITGSGWGVLVGIVAWLGATAYLVRRRTVQAAVAKSGYAVAAVLLVLPLVAFSPLADVEGGLSGRVGLFVVTLVFAAVPAGVAAAIGYVASRFVPDEGTERSD